MTERVAVVVTSIAAPNPVLRALASGCRTHGWDFVVIGDAKNWPPIKDKSLSGRQQKHLWLNRGGKFIDVAPAVGVTDQCDGRSVALVDLWNRGVLDVVDSVLFAAPVAYCWLRLTPPAA